eukprot:CAMPEP_0181125104 /NCGR_PEP_ID=MMETSP1071-20121207/26857_1 /TAXON_ID=35127 /ORGANISM="Thalassiosira sp., Strain NH16" /LENGTH=216 /DNA_ID=CAMNT_0023210495 /DNA_START=241 /DNA_END=890 /DNA_ORIENTATION=-
MTNMPDCFFVDIKPGANPVCPHANPFTFEQNLFVDSPVCYQRHRTSYRAARHDCTEATLSPDLTIFPFVQQCINVRPEDIPRHGTDQRRLDIALPAQKREVRDGIHPEQLYQRPVPAVVAVHHNEVHPIPVLPLHGLEGGGADLAILAPRRPEVDDGGLGVLHRREDFHGGYGMGEPPGVVEDGECEGRHGDAYVPRAIPSEQIDFVATIPATDGE